MTPPMVDDGFQAVTQFDTSDENPAVLVNHVRALQREVRDGFDSIGRALTALGRIEERLIVVIDRQNVLERRLDDHERRLLAIEALPVVVVPRTTVVKKRASRPRKK